MLEQVTEKLRNKGCHYLTNLEYSENSDWISELFFKPSAERSQLLAWCVSQLDPDLEKISPEETLKMTGVCTSSEASSFSSAIMSKNRQLKIWSYLADLLTTSVEDQDTENTRLKLSHSSSFTDALAEVVSSDSTGKLSIFPVHFERELKLSGTSQVSMPSDSQLSSTLQHVQEAFRELDKFAKLEISDRNTGQETLEKIEEVAGEVVKKSEEFNAKNQTEFSSWLQSQHQSTPPPDSSEDSILTAHQTLRSVERFLSSCNTIAQSTNRVLEVGERDLKEFNSSSSGVLSDLNTTVTDHNLSRAPAAS